MNEEPIDFESSEVELNGSNLIEASAGTGKTYSIAILVLRLILEKKILIQDILMVTFTNAAVAELQERIRRFVRSAYRYAQGEKIRDETIKKLVDRHNRKEAEEVLKLAVLNLDETSVMTIHGFCQQTLTEFAFETGQLFSSELIADDSLVLREETQKFWRKYITGIHVELLSLLINRNLNQFDIQSIVKSHIGGKNYIFFESDKEYDLSEERQLSVVAQIAELDSLRHQKEKELLEFVHHNFEKLIGQGSSNSYVNKNILPKATDSAMLLSGIEDKKSLKNVRDTYPEIIELLEEKDSINEGKKMIAEEFMDYLYAFAIQEISAAVKSFMLSHNLLSYDDLIGNLHRALTEKPNPKLEAELRKKYKAVFIDEFQDTDRQQYEIFKTAFQEKSIIFYIGDPKQSIYAWRKADIATYFEARNSVQKVYGMNTNYRSTKNLVTAMNEFFLPTDDFDTFHFAEEKDKIYYHKVDAQQNDGKGNLLMDGEDCLPISITAFKNKDEVCHETARQVLDLLTNENHYFSQPETGTKKKIIPSDIGILVRSKGRAADIKNALNRLRIPAVTNTDDKILDAPETAELVYILEAMLQPGRSGINRALKTSFTNCSTDFILNLDEEKAVQLFKTYNEDWQKKGIYATLMKFIKDFEVRNHLLSGKANNGERILTNLYHLSEILYKAESRQRLNPAELTDWLKKNKANAQNDDNEMEQRIESDENAVNIVTIHSSKGLQYNIVIAPELDLTYNSKHDIINLRNANGHYITAKRNQLSAEEIETHKYQDEQENRRLIYVAITRAVYKCFIYKNNSNYSKNSSLTYFTEQIRETEFIRFTQPVEPIAKYYSPPEPPEQIHPQVEKIELSENNWQQMSYSRLSAHGELPSRENYTAADESYERFIFRDLPKGAHTGNFLHYLFENLNFGHPDSWDFAIDKALARFIPAKKEDLEFRENIRTLLSHVLNAELEATEDTFQLSSLNAYKVLHELEFDFPVALFQPKRLEKLMEDGILISDHFPWKIEGMMTGFVDLFFEHNDKFYVLDWKSNYLGPDLEDYSAGNVSTAMTASNYHLQYLIYSLAIKKYLKSRLGKSFDFEKDFGGVFYLFVRGMRSDKDSGIFYFKPSSEQMKSLESILKRPWVEA